MIMEGWFLLPINTLVISACLSFLEVSFATQYIVSSNAKINAGYEYQTSYFAQQVDHFSFTNNDKFLMRYLIADQYWNKNGGPIFFYTGNEGDITWFCNNTGIMWEWAPEFKAMLVFAEHRYYGESMPYGKDSFKDRQHVGYLTSEQALADYAELILYIKRSMAGATKSPVISFGGSYGGMLSAWFRMKYPHIITGSLAASAPIWQFEGLTPCFAYSKIVTRDFTQVSTSCAKNIKNSWKTLDKLGNSDSGKKYLSSLFQLCQPLKNVQVLKDWLSEAWSDLPMVNYPYPASFLEPLPAWPVQAVCKYLDKPLVDESLAQGIFNAISVYHNYTGQVQCFNLSQEATTDLGDLGWNFQSCSEMVMPMCTDGVQDMFEPKSWNVTDFMKNCQKSTGLTPRPEWIKTIYAGKNISFASNIIFSNGLLDPWSGGGVMFSLSNNLTAIVITEGAHHLDLRSSNPADPPSVIQARVKEKRIIQQWIKNEKSN